MNCTISIDSVIPALLHENEPFKVTWTLGLADDAEARSVTVALLTDDARLVLCDQATHDSPPERVVPVTPGTKVTRTSTVLLQRRKGLVDENSRDGSGSPFFVLARVRNEREEIIASGSGIEVQIAGLAKRTQPRIFA